MNSEEREIQRTIWREQEAEENVRAMRDRVYDQVSTDVNWEGCREHWLKPDAVKWLSERDKKGWKR